MNTRILMTVSAISLALSGLAMTFAPEELLAAVHVAPQVAVTAVVQLCGALYLGFAILNWTTRESILGGIYNRPIVLANTLHFFAGAMTLVRIAVAGRHHPAFLTAMVAYLLFAGAFTYLLFNSPVTGPSPKSQS